MLLTIAQFSEKHRAFSQGSLRNLVYLAIHGLNDFDGKSLNVALVRIGRKLLIDEDKFFEWVAVKNAQPPKPRKRRKDSAVLDLPDIANIKSSITGGY